MMNLIRWNPRRNFPLYHNDINRLIDSFFMPSKGSMQADPLKTWNPAVDILDKDDRILIRAELPGVDKKDFSVNVQEGVLTLKGERSSQDERKKEDNYYRRECFYGRFERSFTLPADVDSEKIKAEYKDGLLTIEVPKAEESKPKQITVH